MDAMKVHFTIGFAISIDNWRIDESIHVRACDECPLLDWAVHSIFDNKMYHAACRGIGIPFSNEKKWPKKIIEMSTRRANHRHQVYEVKFSARTPLVTCNNRQIFSAQC